LRKVFLELGGLTLPNGSYPPITGIVNAVIVQAARAARNQSKWYPLRLRPEQIYRRARLWLCANVDHEGRAFVIAHLAFAEKYNQGPALAITVYLQLAVKAAFGPPDTSGSILFFSRLAAAQSAYKRVASIIDWSGPSLRQAFRLWLPDLRRSFSTHQVQHTKPAPADEMVADCLVRRVSGRRTTPPRTIPDHENNTADNPSIIKPTHAA